MSSWTPDQLKAIETSGTNIIVSAGAGSGKTAVLSERVLQKIKNGTHVNELLILTFTKAAASEMKDRIRKKISDDPSLKEEVKLLPSSYITTFDSYALSIVKKYHYLLNISNNISITDEAIVSIKQKEIIDEIFEEEYKNQNKDFESFIDKYCIKNDNNIRKLILNVSKKIDEYFNSEEFINNIYNNFYSEENVNKLINEYYDLLEEKRHDVEINHLNMTYYFDNDYMTKVNDSINRILVSDIKDMYDASIYYKSLRTIVPSVPRGSGDELKAIKTALKNSIDDLLEFASLGKREELKENILSSKNDVFIILKLIEKYIYKMNKYKKDNNIYTFNDIATLAIKIVKDYKEAREEIKKSFKEIMIDEYQDTNDIQETFISYIQNNNVYMVGDIKQSIYRFRGSNPNIFKEKYDKYSNNDGGIKIDLIKNFRSRSEVKDNINDIFELIMDYNIGGADYKSSHRMEYGNKAYDTLRVDNFNYNIDILEYDNPKDSEFNNNEIEIFAIAKDIKEKMDSNMQVFDKELGALRLITYNDMVIICDRSKHFNTFKKIFEYKGIPLSILKDDDLKLSEDILLIKNIIDFIIKLNNNEFDNDYKYDLVSIARSYLHELSDKEIFDIIKNNKLKDNIIYNSLSKINSINSKTSSMILEEILDITDFYNKLYKIGDYENINVRIKKIYNMSKELNLLGYDIYMFKDYLNNILESDLEIKYKAYQDDSDSVKILTIHKSKGLEWPICYFADIDHDFNYKDATDKVVVDKKYGLIVPGDINETKSLVREIYKNNYKKEEISERIRLFYVALTRAREKAIIVLPYKEIFKLEKNIDGVIEEARRNKFNGISDFVYAIKDYCINYFSQIDINKLNLTKNYLLNKINNNNIDKKDINLDVKEININNELITTNHYSKETHNLIDNQIKKNMEYGTKVHEIFELIDFKNSNKDLIKDEFIRNKVDKFLNNPLLKDVNKANIYKEYEFIYTNDSKEQHGIIDLMLEYDDRIDIIDYKLKHITDEAYKKQLNGYKSYIESKSNKKVNLYLYSIIDEQIYNIN